MVEYEFIEIQHQSDEYQRIDSSIHDLILKVNSKDNTITIKRVKDSWNREEIIKLLDEYMMYFQFHSISDKDNWIEQNL